MRGRRWWAIVPPWARYKYTAIGAKCYHLGFTAPLVRAAGPQRAAQEGADANRDWAIRSLCQCGVRVSYRPPGAGAE